MISAPTENGGVTVRDPKRIYEFCAKLATFWSEEPDWRFGQLIFNVLGTSQSDPFFMEEDEMMKLFEDYFKRTEGQQCG